MSSQSSLVLTPVHGRRAMAAHSMPAKTKNQQHHHTSQPTKEQSEGPTLVGSSKQQQQSSSLPNRKKTTSSFQLLETNALSHIQVQLCRPHQLLLSKKITTTSSSETSPLLSASAAASYSRQGIRARRTHSQSPVPTIDQRNGNNGASSSQQGGTMNPVGSSASNPSLPQQQQQQYQQHYDIMNENSKQQQQQQQQPAVALLEIPEEVYAVRKAALRVLKPLTKTWLVVSVGFALTVLFGMARWTGMLLDLPFWFILFPSWMSHVGLFWCHILSAKALSTFISEANDSRQRPDSRDHLDRTEYLPLLQKSLKFGLKTGIFSFTFFVFELLVYLRLHNGTMSLSMVFLPIWVVVLVGVVDGIICKTSHPSQLLCWLLVFTSMLLACLKVDFGVDAIRWRVIMAPIVTFLCICSATLIYVIYGNQVGYYRLTESQLTAANLYSLATLFSVVVTVVIGEVIPLSRPVEIETRLFVVLMAPLVVTLVGMGAWVVSRDEYGRLLLYGGQSAVHPRKLRWESKGWTSVQGKGVTHIPMFGDVSFHPLEKKVEGNLELCLCCTCYPIEEEEEQDIQYPPNGHFYLNGSNPQAQ